MRSRPRLVAGVSVVWMVGLVATADAQELTREEMRQFLLNAQVTKARDIPIGVTQPMRLTLSDGRITHDAAFNFVDERRALMKFDDGRQEVNFVDSYRYNVAAYHLAELVGLEDMMPVTVERSWNGKTGSLSWWIDDVLMDERTRLQSKPKVQPPSVLAWNRQMYTMRVFSRLVYDTDRNLTNVLITKDWRCFMIDFTRAFRLWEKIEHPNDVQQIPRALLERLRELKAEDVARATEPHLTRYEVAAVMARRDLLVAHFDRLIAEKGAGGVLF